MTQKSERLFVKLCGFVRPGDVAAASALDLDALGFVLADDARVPLEPAHLTDLFGACTRNLTKIAVVGPKTQDECRRILDLGFDAVQVVVTDWFASTLDGKPVIPVFFDSPDVEQRMLTLEHRTLRHLDSAQESRTKQDIGRHGLGLVCLDGPGGGGRGEPADWTRARALAEKWPLLLAGGLRSDSVGRAIAQVRPRGLDVSSGVEAAPGCKDPGKMAAFVAAVRAAEQELC